MRTVRFSGRLGGCLPGGGRHPPCEQNFLNDYFMLIFVLLILVLPLTEKTSTIAIGTSNDSNNNH